MKYKIILSVAHEVIDKKNVVTYITIMIYYLIGN